MKNFVFSTIAILSLGACATTSSGYGPANSAADMGFKNTQIEQDRFRISYTGRTAEEARDYVLYRAAEIALNEGYTHFKILNGGSSGNGPRPNLGTHVGVGIGSLGRRNHSNMNLGLGVGDLGRVIEGSKQTETIEILLENSTSQDPNVYDAQSVSKNLRPQVFK